MSMIEVARHGGDRVLGSDNPTLSEAIEGEESDTDWRLAAWDTELEALHC